MKDMHLRPLATAVLLGLAGAALAQRPAPATATAAGDKLTRHTAQRQPRPEAPARADDRTFMRSAAESGHAEIAAAQLVLERSDDDGVKRFAHQLIDDHTKANAKLQQLAARKHLTLPGQPSAMQQSKLTLLKAERGHNFDESFLRVFGVQAHRQAIQLFEGERAYGRDADAKAFAAAVLPKLREHLRIAQQQLSARVEASANTARPYATPVTASANIGDSELQDAQELVRDAVQTVQQMKGDPRVIQALHRARGVFILPHYGRGALGIGAQGGEGVLVARQGKDFGNPVFYTLAGVSVGLQAGGSGGPVALLLMTDRAVRDFESGKNFSLDADAAVTVADWSRRAQASGGKVQDVVAWSGAKGAYAGASVGVTDVIADAEANRAYYGRERVDPAQVVAGRVDNPHHNVLGRVLGL